MHITVCLTDLKSDAWVAGLQSEFPDAHVSVWQPGAPPASASVRSRLAPATR